MTAPSLNAASTISQRGTSLPSIEENAIAARDAQPAQKSCDAVRALGESGKTQDGFRAVFVEHLERRAAVPRRNAVEIIERPVEFVHLRPVEMPAREVLVAAMLQQEIPSLQKFICAAHAGHFFFGGYLSNDCLTMSSSLA